MGDLTSIPEPATTVALFYSADMGGSWHIHNAQMDDGGRFHRIHVFMGEPRHDLKAAVTESGQPWIQIPWRSRHNLPLTVLRVWRLLRRHRVDVVHGHGIEGTLTSLLAARLARTPRRIHTRHHGTMHHLRGPRRAVAVDRLVNRLSTEIIATCAGVRRCLIELEGVDPDRIRVLEYRLDVSGFARVPETRIANVRSRHDLPSQRPIVGMVSRFVWWKGVEYGVAAFAEILEDHPDAILVVAGGVGPHKDVAQPILDQIGTHHFRIIEHEQDIAALLHTFDVCLHLPVDPGVEAWGQVYVEVMAAGVPLVCTRSGIAVDHVVDGTDCLVADYRDVPSVTRAIRRLLSDPVLVEHIVRGGRTTASTFARTPDLNTLDFLYGSAPPGP